MNHDRAAKIFRSRPLRRIGLLGALFVLAARFAAAQDIDPASGNAQPFPGTAVSGYVLAWSDEFNSTSLNTTKWDYRTDSKHWSTQLPANVTLSSGTLRLNLKKENAGGMAYTGAGVISKTARRYGYYEARMKTPPGAGWHSSFWMMKHNGSGGTGTATTAIELDVIENDSISPLKYGVNAHKWNPAPHVSYGSRSVTTPSLSADFHVFGCEFTAATVKYFFDGTLVQTVDATLFPHGDVNVWLTSIASSLGGTTAVDDTQLPATVQFDYARFFLPGPTSTLSIVSPSSGGITVSDTVTTLRVTALATSSDVNFPPTVLWTKLSGPGVVTFANAASADTSAQFSAPGSYVLQCEATVGTSVSTAQIPVAVNAPLIVTLRQGESGYSHAATFIRGDSTGWNSGARDQFLVGRVNSQPLRALFSFDLAMLDSTAVIQSASLDLWTIASAGVGTVGGVELRSLNATPVEGTGDGSSAANGAGTGATWLKRTSSDLWTNAGGDFGATVLSNVPGFDATVPLAQKTFASSASFVTAVQSAVNASAPLNLIALAPASESGAVNAYSRLQSDDSSTLAQRPRLTLTFLGNLAPTLSASIAPVITVGLPAALGGSASGATSSEWSTLSGAVTFADATSPGTTATFSQPGNYLLQLRAINARGETSRTFSVTVLSGLETWRQTHFGSTANNDLADSNGDGEVNLLEFATAQNPHASTRTQPALVKNGATLEFTYTRSLAAMSDAVTFAVEWSDTLASWSSAGVSEQILSDNGTVQIVRASIAAGASGRRFLHLKVSG